jgi:hypothetical protein
MLPRLSAWPEWHRLKEARRAVQVRAIKGVAECGGETDNADSRPVPSPNKRGVAFTLRWRQNLVPIAMGVVR